jgi:tRNA A37 N6-isopentenylltransferase MiaA
MDIDLSWDNNEHKALLYQFPDQWTWEDFYNVKIKADKLLDDVDYNVVLIFDMTSTRSIPSGVLAQARWLISRAHPRGKPIVLVGTNMVIQAMLNLVNKFNKNAPDLIMAVSTVEQARKFVQNRDNTLLT